MKSIPQYLVMAAIYFAYLSTFLTVSIQKIQSGAPEWFLKQFNGTFIEKLPGGAKAGFWMITFLETSVAILLCLALLNREWHLGEPMVWLPIAISLSAFTFAVLGFGLRISNDFQGASNLFSYFGVSLIVLLILNSKLFT